MSWQHVQLTLSSFTDAPPSLPTFNAGVRAHNGREKLLLCRVKNFFSVLPMLSLKRAERFLQVCEVDDTY